jgi:hypothetical protein
MTLKEYGRKQREINSTKAYIKNIELPVEFSTGVKLATL